MKSPDGNALNLEISTCSYSEQGLDGFYWPISYSGRREFANTYIANLKTFFAGISEDKREDAEVLLTLQSNLFVIATSIAQASVLDERSKGLSVEYPKARALCWSAKSPQAWFEQYLKKLFTLADEPTWKKYGRYLKYAMKKGRIKAQPLKVSSKKFPIITGVSPLLEQYLDSNNIKKAVYVPYTRWFTTLTDQEKSNASVSAVSDDLIDRFMACIPKIDDHKISNAYQNALRSFIVEASRNVKLYLHRLQNDPSQIPTLFLSGSMGMLLNSILALSVRRNGGKVIGFDHGNSCNIWSSSTTPFVETQLNDTFYTFSHYAAQAIMNGMQRQHFSWHTPAIEYYKTASSHDVLNVSKDTQTNGKTIMFVQTLFIGDQGELDPIMPNVVAADWQVRLFHNLKSLGYDILLKPHPLSGSQIPQDVLERLDIKVANAPFEEVCMSVDILMYDYALSTTFHTGMLTDKPMLYFHFSDSKYPSEIKDALENRIEIISGLYDEDNRAQCDWNSIKDAIERAKKKTDQTICELVLPSFETVKSV